MSVTQNSSHLIFTHITLTLPLVCPILAILPTNLLTNLSSMLILDVNLTNAPIFYP